MQTSQAAISTPAQAIATPITMGSLKTFKTSVIVVQLLSTSQRFGAKTQLLVTLLHLQEFLLQLLTSTIIMKYLQCMICHTVGMQLGPLKPPKLTAHARALPSRASSAHTDISHCCTSNSLPSSKTFKIETHSYILSALYKSIAICSSV